MGDISFYYFNWNLKIGFKISLPANILHRVHLIERKKAERKVDLLEKKLAGVNRFTPYMSMKEQEDSFMMKVRTNFDWFLKKQDFLLPCVTPDDNWQMLSGLLVLFLWRIKGSSTAWQTGRVSEVWRKRARQIWRSLWY